jgi:hypothetical protein
LLTSSRVWTCTWCSESSLRSMANSSWQHR